MPIGYVLYNKKAGRNRRVSDLKMLEDRLNMPLKFIDIEKIKSYPTFLSSTEEGDVVVLCGGDGTLNCFINNIESTDYKCEVWYYPNGTGNDFAHEMGCNEKGLITLTEHIKNLPTVTVNGKDYKFINGVGYGIDGYCCEVGDKQRMTSDKPVNYTSITIKGLLFHYKPTAAKITVDGVTHTYKKVWLAPTMLGKYYGGGMMPAPGQSRSNGNLSIMIFHSSSKLRSLMIFPSIFTGKHIKHKKNITVIEGNNITVEYARPTALQIDGETITGVTSYTANSVLSRSYLKTT